DDISYNRGAHSLKFGFTWKRLQLNGDNPSRPAGEFRFRSLTDFLRNVPRDFRGDVSPEGTSIRGLRMNIVGWYIQDDYQFSPNLTFNLGFRHEFYTVPNEVQGKLANLRDPLNDTAVNYNAQINTGEAWFNNPSKASIMPRVGIAWDPTGAGRTAIRLGAGLFYNHIQPDTFRRAIFRTQPFALETQVGGSTIRGGCSGQNGSCFPNIFDKIVDEGLGDPDLQIFPFDYMRNPHMWQWNLNFQHEVLTGTAVSASYAGNRGLNIMHQTNLNTGIADVVNGRYVFPVGAQVRNQGFPNLALLSQETSTDSWYHAVQLGLQRRFQDGFQVQVSYTFSRTVDESSQINSAFDNNGGGVSYYPDPDMRRSLAAFHVANVFAASGVWQLPFARTLDGLAGGILDGWQLSAVLKLADGPPLSLSTEDTVIDDLNISLETPDQVGSTNNPVLGGADLYFDPTAFAPPPARTIGNVGRNTLHAAGLASLDLSLTKKTSVGENVTVEFRAEFFNIFNRTNLGLPETQVVENPVYNADGSVASFDIDPDAGFIDNATIKQREIQLGLRIVF
ncbi:MAG: TonB-dependent receptor, partial [Acidobacteria bacterium]|nr:TonB-dependent receptor [Acidobacteriota bacterium]